MRTLLYQGSVKNIFTRGEDIEFEFTDQYSIFDWGVMPDLIDNKGSNLAKMASFFFEQIESSETYSTLFENIEVDELFFQSTQNLELIEKLKTNGGKTHFKELLPPSSIVVSPVAIKKPTFQDGQYQYPESLKTDTNTLIPLEVVFRFGAPEGSSYLKRHPNVSADQKFNEIVVEFFSKLEPQDRLLTQDEAVEISGLSQTELDELVFYTKTYALLLHKTFKSTGINLWDGKFEFAYGGNAGDTREIVLVDSIGADELRLDYEGIPLSKELLRKLYRKDEWYFELEKNKKEFPQNFIDKTIAKPRNLSQAEQGAAKAIYENIVQCLTQKTDFEAGILKNFMKTHFQRVAVFGQGGREHALAEHLIQDRYISKVFLIPGNPGVQNKNIHCVDLSAAEYVHFCQHKKIDYAVIGPEALLEKGLVNQLEAQGIPCASPSKEAALLETSKAFAKSLMKKHGIPTAAFESFTNTQEAIDYVTKAEQDKFVVKLSGLAAGKGVILCDNKEDTVSAIKALAPNDEELVIEELLVGPEVSYFALCLEDEYQILGTACDYKRLLDNNEGPNTGGMGCYSPATWLTPEQDQEIKEKVLIPTLAALTKEKIKFKGMLFIGLMMTEQGAKVLEYNTRFGDPETQTILPRLKESAAPVLRAIAFEDKAALKASVITSPDNYSVHIVKAAKGYPGTQGMVVEKGQLIKNNFQTKADEKLFFAGVKSQGSDLLTNGGRVLGVTCIANTSEDARAKAYAKLEEIHFDGEQFRGDIGL